MLVEFKECHPLVYHGFLPEGLKSVSLVNEGFFDFGVNLIGHKQVANLLCLGKSFPSKTRIKL